MHPSLKAIPSYRDFTNATRYKTTADIKKAKHAIFGQGKEIDKIYKSLADLERGIEGKPHDVEQLLHCVIVDCDDWLEKKAKRKTSTNFSTRAAEVRKLLVAAKKAFGDIRYKSAAFDANKSQGGGVPTIPLFGGYALEREAFVASDKTRSPAAGPVLTKAPAVASLGEYMRTYESLDKGKSGLAQDVMYLRQRDRLEYLVVLDNGKFYSEAGILKQSKMTGTASTVYGEMYAMDRHGNLFARDLADFNANTGGYGYFNHSSLNAGREIICAGVCLFKNGSLVFADNASGHYKPGRDRLQSMLAFLASHHFDLSRTRVDVFGTPERHIGSEFVTSPNGKGNWKPSINTDWPSGKDVTG